MFKPKSHLPTRILRYCRPSLVVPIMLFAGCGTYALLGAHAATPTISVELENGTRSSAASLVTDSTASNNQAVKFGSGTTSTDFCSSYPARPSSKPDATNTGVPAGTTLTSSGSITASTAGQVINAKNITGTIYVSANNVTIQNSNFLVTDTYYGIRIADGVTGTKILHNRIYTNNGGYEGILGSNMTICGNYITGFENPITANGAAVIQANFIEKLASNQPGAHYDAIEVYSGNNTSIWGNNLMMTDPSGAWLTETGAINVTGTWSSIDNTVINGNWLGGGSYTLNLDDGQGYAVTNLKVTNNVFYGSAPKGHAYYGINREPSVVTTWSGNTWSDTGQTATD